jgi:hypothetical protein
MILLGMQERRTPERFVDNIERIYRQYIREDQIKAIKKVIMECSERK